MSRRPAAVKNLVCFLGPPASGKGSYSKLCTETFRRLNQPVSRFIASDLIRAEMAAGTTAGLAMKPFMEQHRHVPSELIVDVVWRNLEGLGEEGEGKRGVILDGFPRSTEQAELFLRGVSGAGGIKGESGEGAGRAVRLSGVHLDLRWVFFGVGLSSGLATSQDGKTCPSRDDVKSHHVRRIGCVVSGYSGASSLRLEWDHDHE